MVNGSLRAKGGHTREFYLDILPEQQTESTIYTTRLVLAKLAA